MRNEAEDIGLLKMDFLGLKTLTVLFDCLDSIERAGHGRIDLDALPMDDELTYKLFQDARDAPACSSSSPRACGRSCASCSRRASWTSSR